MRATSRPPETQCHKDAAAPESLTPGGRPRRGTVNSRRRRRSLGIDAQTATTADPAALVRAAQAGDRTALGVLYSRYAGLVHAIAISRVPVDEAADVVQDVFLKVLRQLPTLKDPNAIGAWVAAIARNTALDAVLRPRGADPADWEPQAPATQHDDMEARAALAAIRSLPHTYRDTLMMRLVEGMSGPEIADCTALTPASVRVNLHRGMKLLRRRLQQVRTTAL